MTGSSPSKPKPSVASPPAARSAEPSLPLARGEPTASASSGSGTDALPESKEAVLLSPGVPPLFRRYPALREHVAWASLGAFPTEVFHATRLGARLHLGQLSIKRDDLAAAEYGGSKVRKLEFYLGEARRRGVSRVLTIGSVSSNQAAAVAIFAKRFGLSVELLLLPGVATEMARSNLLLAARAGARMKLVGSYQKALAIAEARSVEYGGDLLVIPAGASTPLGNLGFVNAAFELDEQIRRGELLEPRRVYIALGTMGSAVGLAIGLAAVQRPIEVVAVRASNPGTSSERKARALAEATIEFLHQLDPTFPELGFEQLRLRIVGSQLGRGYGIATNSGTAAAELMRETEELFLDSTYTAKAFAALIAEAPELEQQPVLFWLTASPPLPVDSSGMDNLPKELRGYARP